MTTQSETRRFLEKLIGEPSFGETIAALRQADESSQASWAKMLGVSRQLLNDVAKGRRKATIDLASKWARILGVSSSVLIQRALQDQLKAAKISLRVKLETA